jgi:hypothetical protein
MTRRTRSILIDATLGKMFTGTADLSTATAANLIAGSTLRNVQNNYGTSVTTAKVVTNAFKALSFPSNSIITSVKVMTNTGSTGASIILTLKTGTTYATSTSVGTVSLAASTSSATTSITISVAAGDSLFADITQVGSTKPGGGLSYTAYYFIGY